jgi:putative aldouronate transport system permease protein
MGIRKSLGEHAFDGFNIIFLLLLSAIVIFPLLHIVAGSLSSANLADLSKVTIWPSGFTLSNYEKVISNPIYLRSFGVTLIVVVCGTLLNLAMTIFTAYPLTRTYLKGRKFVLMFIVFTMIFQAPLIPTYLVVKALGLLDTLWALMIPSAIGAFNLFLCITFFRSVPEDLIDAAKVDGVSEYGIVWRIMLPLSLPIIVTLLLFYSVGHWNNYFTALLYITNLKLRTLQMYLYALISQGSSQDSSAPPTDMVVSPQSIQMATVVISTIPIMLVYPFLQKHFIKGALLGSVKE